MAVVVRTARGEVVEPPSHRNDAADRATSPKVSPCAMCQSRAQRLPSIISKQYASKRDEGSDHDRRCRGTGCALGLPPCCQVEHHCHGDAPSERQVVCIAQRAASGNFFPTPTYWPLPEAVSIKTSGVVEFEGIRFDFATKGLIELTGRSEGFSLRAGYSGLLYRSLW